MATYGSYGGCSAGFRAVMLVAGPALGCRLATYGSYVGCWPAFTAVGWRPTGLMVVAGPPLAVMVVVRPPLGL